MLRQYYVITRIHRIAPCLILSLILGLAGCGDDSPTSADDDDGGGDVTAPAAVTDLRTDSPTTSSMVIMWTAPGDDGHTGTASQYDLRYSTSAITKQNWVGAVQVDGESSPKAAGGLETIIVANLDPGTRYHFALKTSDEVPNTSELSNVAADSTQQEHTPPGAITDLLVECIDDGMFRLTWTAPGDDGNVGNASQYDIRYFTNPITENTWADAVEVAGEPAPKPAGFPDTMLVTGLTAGTNFFFAMKTADDVPNWSDISNPYPALAKGNNLWLFPDLVKAGKLLTIIYRTPGSGTSKLHAHYRDEADQWARLVIEWEWPPGIHTREWDFKRSGTYHSYPYTFYTFKLYWNSVVVAEDQAFLQR